MNKVYKFSKNLLKLSVPLSIILGLQACSTYNYTSNVESNGIYYNPKTDKTYTENESQNNSDPSGIKVGSPYFDANGNGAEDFYYSAGVNNNANTANVSINQYGLGYGAYNISPNVLSLQNDSSWGKNDGVNINIYSNGFSGRSLWNPYYRYNYGFGLGFGFGWGWNSGFYGSNYWGWDNGFYGAGYGYGYGGYYGSPWGWNNGFYGPGYGYGGYYGSPWGWNNGFYGPSYGYGGGYYYNKPYYNNATYNRPGSRPSNGVYYQNDKNNVLSRPVTNNIRPGGNTPIVRPSNNGQSLNNNQGAVNRPSRETRPGNTIPQGGNTPVVRPSNNEQGINNNQGTIINRPSRETRPGNINSQGINNNNQGINNRPVRETRPVNVSPQRPNINSNSRPNTQQSPSNQGFNNSRTEIQRPSSSPSFNRGSSIPSSSGGGFRGGATGGNSGGSSGGGSGRR